MNAALILPVDLSHCDSEPIHTPGAIQPHGVLLVLQEKDLTVVQVSENVQRILGLSVAQVLQQPLSRLADTAAVERMQAALNANSLENINPLRVKIGDNVFDGILHRHEQTVILELEPITPLPLQTSPHHPLRHALGALQFAGTVIDLCNVVVEEVRQLTGFERVMLYRFDADDHGCVTAEAKDDELDAYLGLHYPASDIPRQARELYLKNWLRITPDARYQPARIVPATRNNFAPLDLSLAVLRSVSPIHLEYLANIGMRATMNISLIVRGRLWGLISCAHHSAPRSLPYELRSSCEVLGRLASLQIAALEDRDAAELRLAGRATQNVLVDAIRSAQGITGVLRRPDELMALANAHGAVYVCGAEQQACGKTPPPEIIAALAEWLDAKDLLTCYSTASLSEVFPSALSARDVASGLLSFALPGKPYRRLMWFRPELIATVNWGGDPRKPVELDPTLRIHPRRSFELWKEEVRLHSTAWSVTDIESAEELRRCAIELDLERQIARERQAVRARDDLVAVVSHDLRNPLNVIQMQAMILVRTVGIGEEDSSRRVRASAEHIQRSIDRMNALIADLLDLGKLEAGRFTVQCYPCEVAEMIGEALTIMRPLSDARNVELVFKAIDARVYVDMERVFQVLSNLIGNALKFTPMGGRISVLTEALDGEVLVTVEDTGPGIPADQLENIFERYWQARRSDREGSGLGLFIAKGIVEAHGGRLWTDPKPNRGARFLFTLPLA